MVYPYSSTNKNKKTFKLVLRTGMKGFPLHLPLF